MAEQVIGFCETRDGVRIAYATVGTGQPLVYVTGWPVHLELEWSKAFVREFLSSLASGLMLVRYDMRGSGLSDRDVSDFSIPALLQDLEAVTDHLGLTRFALLGLGDLAGPLAIAYAAANQTAITHLILHSAYARGSDLASPEHQEATVNFVESFGFPILEFVDAPDLDVAKQRDLREINEAACSHGMQAALLRTMYAADVTPLLKDIAVPVLLMHARNDALVPFEAGRQLAIRLPHAEFLPFEGTGASPWVHQHILLPKIRSFLGLSFPNEPQSARVAPLQVEALGQDILTAREVEILCHLAAGQSSREIAESLVLSTRTVERHISNVYAKIGVSTRAQATAYALMHGLVSPPAT
jgi:pimeloyl-ACP methyl ester carboxylesterase/DNA-binding CsgD family transcriptional regulator